MKDRLTIFQKLDTKLGAEPWITGARMKISPKTTWQQVKEAVQTGNMVIRLVHGIQGLYMLAVQQG